MDGILYSNIFELIFKNTIDPIILEKLKRVHIHWKNSIDKILETTDKWKSACLNEIASEPISGMITRLYPTLSFDDYHELDDFKVWRTVYISYRKWMILSKLRVSVEFVYSSAGTSYFPEEIRNFASCDKYFAVGTNRLKIYVFGFNQSNKPMYSENFDNYIKDIRFWYPGTGDVFLVVIVRPYHIKFFNVSNNMTEVLCINVENPEATTLCTGTINTLVTMDSGDLVQYKYNTDDGLMQYTTGRLSGTCVKLFSEKKKLICLTSNGHSLTLRNYRIPTSDKNNDMILEKSVQILRPDFATFEFRNPSLDFLTSNVILQKSTEGYSCLIIDDHQTDWHIHYPFQKFGSENLVTSGVLHGKILILGFKTGHVRIFTVENIEQLKNSELDLYSGIEYLVDNEPIQWLQVAEAQEKLIIIAITYVKIYFINFTSENSIE
ncbi:uncharacterized protein LOC130675454 isoform X1 [Microplitis mediator]|uniref:uncharacterized protein LOC130675454 isoform X1 n=1 Tax=Microplitis mediator TaxID=375433 RepID=UPI0025547906|nr:uncharacterized protein LOC130675454 isoform X1 [Microplitis mediator]